MPVEDPLTVLYATLQPTDPDGAEPVSEGDDHLRMLKSCIQNQWPNFEALACTPTVAEINTVAGATSSIQNQLDNLQAQITANDSDITALSNSVDANATAIASNDSDIASLQSKVATLESQMATALLVEIGVNQTFLCRGTFPTNGRWSFIGDTNDAVPLIRSYVAEGFGGSWLPASFMTIDQVDLNHAHSVSGTAGAPSVTHQPATYTGSSGAISAGQGNDGELFDHTVGTSDVTGSTDGALGSHAHSISDNLDSSGNAIWRPQYREMWLARFNG